MTGAGAWSSPAWYGRGMPLPDVGREDLAKLIEDPRPRPEMAS